MKRHLTLALVFLSVPALMGAAQADVIAGPAVAVLCTVRFLPWILVGARSEERRVGKECM